MPRTTPPFSADQVGSFLRTDAIHEARAAHEAGDLDAAGLKAVEDREIIDLIHDQEKVGLQLATDGEFRRSWWHFDFIGLLTGVEIVEIDHGIQFQGVQTKPQSPVVTGKIGFPSDHPFLDHFRFLAANTTVTPKMTIPSPTVRTGAPKRPASTRTSTPIATPSSTTSPPPTAPPCRRSTTPDAVTYSSTTPRGRTSARRPRSSGPPSVASMSTASATST